MVIEELKQLRVLLHPDADKDPDLLLDVEGHEALPLRLGREGLVGHEVQQGLLFSDRSVVDTNVRSTVNFVQSETYNSGV